MSNRKNNTSAKKTQTNYVWSILVLSWILFEVLASMSPDERLWGFHLGAYLPMWLRMSLLGLSILIAFPNIFDLFTSKKKLENRYKGNSWLAPTILIAFFVVVGFLFRVHTFFLGNSTDILFRIFNVLEGKTFEAGVLYQTQPASTYFYLELSKFLYKLNGFNPVDLFLLVGCLSGIVFLYGALRFVRLLTEVRVTQYSYIFLLIGMPSTVFFFGYPEYYTLMYTCLIWYFYFVVKAIVSNEKLIIPGIILAIAVIFHITAILLLPSYLILLYERHVMKVKRFRSILIMILLSVVLGFIFYFLSGQWKSGGFFIPLFEIQRTSRYLLFSQEHLIDIVNLIGFYLAPALIIFIFIFHKIRKEIPTDSLLIHFALMCTAFPLMFLGVWNSLLGMARDWDVASFFGLSATVSIILVINSTQKSKELLRRFSIPVSIFSLIVLIPWIMVNTITECGVKRFETLLRMNAPFITRQGTITGYENLRKYYEAIGDVDGELVTMKVLVQYSFNPFDIIKLATVIRKSGNHSTAAPFLENAIQRLLEIGRRYRDSTGLSDEEIKELRNNWSTALIECMKCYLIFNRVRDGVERAKLFIKEFPDESIGYSALAHCKNAMSDFESSLNYCTIGTRLKNADRVVFYYRAYAQFKLQQYDSSKASYLTSLQLDSLDLMPYFGLGLLYIEGFRDTTVAVSYFNTYLAKNSKSETAARIKSILNTIHR